MIEFLDAGSYQVDRQVEQNLADRRLIAVVVKGSLEWRRKLNDRSILLTTMAFLVD